MVALKEVKIKETISKKEYQSVINEVEMMKKITHPNIIQLYDSFIDRQYDTDNLKKNIQKMKEAQIYGNQTGTTNEHQNGETIESRNQHD